MVKRSKKKPSKFAKAIQALRRMRPHQRTIAIRQSNDRFIRDVVSHVRKLRNAKLSPKMAKQVKRHSQKLRWFINPKISLKKKRNCLVQKGGFFPALVPILGPIMGAVAGPLISSLLSK